MLWLAAVQPVAKPEDSSAATAEFLNNCRTEVFALHLRNLIMFLYPERFGRQVDDVSAHHFLKSPDDWIRGRGVLSPLLESAKKRADKELAHLTTARYAGTPPEKYWDVHSLLRTLNDVLVVFVARADSNRLGTKARAALAGLAEGVARAQAI